MRQLPDLVVNQRDIRRLHGNVTADAAHRDADPRRFQGGRVIDAVSDHTHGLAFLLVFSDAAQLIFRQTAGAHLLNAEPGCNGLRRVLVVARQQNGPHAEGG